MSNLAQCMWQNLNCLAVIELVGMLRELVFPLHQRTPQLDLDCIPACAVCMEDKSTAMSSWVDTQDTE